MIRYFYTDPLAAAWMEKHFSMTFVDLPFGLIERGPFLGKSFEFVSFPTASKLCIHSDSLHLLEPRVGDLYEIFETRPQKLPVKGKGEEGPFDEPYGTHLSTLLMRKLSCVWSEGIRLTLTVNWPIRWPNLEIRIHQRDGKAFHWPECEAI